MEPLGTRSLAQVQAHVWDRLAGGDATGALDAVRHFVELVINDPRATSRVLSNALLDALCLEIGRRHLAAHPATPAPAGNGGTVLLLTEAQGHGGHIELARDLLACGVLDPVHVIMTDTFARAGSAGPLEGKRAASVHVVQGASSGERLARLVHALRERAPHTIVLLVHHQDSTALAALHAYGAPVRVLFVHHADHHLCLGAAEPGFTHVDLHPMGFHECRPRLDGRNVYWPLTVQESGANAATRGFLRGGSLLTCSSGREAKYDASSYLYDYAELLPRMLQASRGRHLHIGPLSEATLARLRGELAAAQVDAGRLRHIPWVPSLGAALINEGVDLYVSSFPLGGGKAALECMASGIPLLMHENYQSRLLGGVDLAYKDAYVWRTPDDLERVLGDTDAQALSRHSRLARMHFETHYAPHLLAQAVASDCDNAALMPPMRRWQGDQLQTYLDEKQREALDRIGAIAESRCAPVVAALSPAPPQSPARRLFAALHKRFRR